MSDAVKVLLQHAIEKTKESHRICSAGTNSDTEGGRAIARLVIVLEGRLEALNTVYDAMCGNKAFLRHWANS